MTPNEDYVRERLKAYIYPNSPKTRDQVEAFENAVEVQLKYEREYASYAAPDGVAAYSNDGMSVTFDTARGFNGANPARGLCPDAYAYLYNAGLIGRALPIARRLYS